MSAIENPYFKILKKKKKNTETQPKTGQGPSQAYFNWASKNKHPEPGCSIKMQIINLVISGPVFASRPSWF